MILQPPVQCTAYIASRSDGTYVLVVKDRSGKSNCVFRSVGHAGTDRWILERMGQYDQ